MSGQARARALFPQASVCTGSQSWAALSLFMHAAAKAAMGGAIIAVYMWHRWAGGGVALQEGSG